jgi:hypothetical protein
MSWVCNQCGLTLVNIVKKCYCGELRGEFEPFDSIDEIISAFRLAELDKYIGDKMTAQEELFSKLFNHEKVLVKDMDILSLRAHREELAHIAFEARARLAAVDDEEKGRQKKAKAEKGPTGFATSLNSDDKTSDAINTIKERGKRISKMDNIKQKMLKIPGIDPKFVESVMQARNIRDQISKISLPASNDLKEAEPETTKKVTNPFAKKES